MKRFFLAGILALALLCGGARAQDRSSRPYTIVVGHVVTIGWTASTTQDVTSYNIYVSGVTGGPYNKIGSSSTTSFKDYAAIAGHTYFYVVTAVDVNGESAFSAEASATLPTP